MDASLAITFVFYRFEDSWWMCPKNLMFFFFGWIGNGLGFIGTSLIWRIAGVAGSDLRRLGGGGIRQKSIHAIYGPYMKEDFRWFWFGLSSSVSIFIYFFCAITIDMYNVPTILPLSKSQHYLGGTSGSLNFQPIDPIIAGKSIQFPFGFLMSTCIITIRLYRYYNMYFFACHGSLLLTVF